VKLPFFNARPRFAAGAPFLARDLTWPTRRLTKNPIEARL
jgi:hypothetical protein